MSNERHELGDDKFIELIDPEDLTSKQHRQVTGILTNPDTSGLPLGSRTLAVRDFILSNCLVAWSFGAKPKRNDVENVNVPIGHWKKICVILDRYSRVFLLNLDEDDTEEDGTPPGPSDS